MPLTNRNHKFKGGRSGKGRGATSTFVREGAKFYFSMVGGGRVTGGLPPPIPPRVDKCVKGWKLRKTKFLSCCMQIADLVKCSMQIDFFNIL